MQNKTDQLLHNISKGRESEGLNFSCFTPAYGCFNSAICAWGEFSLELALRLSSAPPLGSLPPHHHHRLSCHPRHASWELSLGCILPWLLSPTAVWAPQLSPYLPAAPASSAVHCAKCEVIKTQKTPLLSWEENWKAHICQKRQHAANFAWFESALRVCQLLCAYTIGSSMCLALQGGIVWGSIKFIWTLMMSLHWHRGTSPLLPGYSYTCFFFFFINHDF